MVLLGVLGTLRDLLTDVSTSEQTDAAREAVACVRLLRASARAALFGAALAARWRSLRGTPGWQRCRYVVYVLVGPEAEAAGVRGRAADELGARANASCPRSHTRLHSHSRAAVDSTHARTHTATRGSSTRRPPARSIALARWQRLRPHVFGSATPLLMFVFARACVPHAAIGVRHCLRHGV
jgi:hypothetical protein